MISPNFFFGQTLTSNGHDAEEIVALTISDLECLPLDAEGGKLVQRYFERRQVVGPVRPHATAFNTCEGAALKSDSYTKYVAGIKRIGLNAAGFWPCGLISTRLMSRRLKNWQKFKQRPDPIQFLFNSSKTAFQRVFQVLDKQCCIPAINNAMIKTA